MAYTTKKSNSSCNFEMRLQLLFFLCLLLRNDKLAQGFLEAVVEDGGFVREDCQVVFFEAIEKLGNELPFAVTWEIGLTQEITNHDVSLPKGYNVTLLKCL